ncbi:ribosome-binding protein 1-like [Mixophyes fleayi]|uniref:ribosome-binding protein 1-like n=1 Tax=Mixophyes fleayi TaxID=3061075 RepID=UPI003F4DF906
MKKAAPLAVANELDGALFLPYKTLVSTISSMAFSEGEAQKLIEILTEKNGIKQDTWHTATQKGDPVTALKRQLEEKEKLLSAEQEDAAAAKNRLREINKELAAEKAKVNSVESKAKEQILSRDQEINALQARMQASYKDHVTEIQQLQGKVQCYVKVMGIMCNTESKTVELSMESLSILLTQVQQTTQCSL